MEFVEQLGGYFESSGLTRLAGRLLGRPARLEVPVMNLWSRGWPARTEETPRRSSPHCGRWWAPAAATRHGCHRPLMDVGVHGQDNAIPLGMKRTMPIPAAVAAAERLWAMGFPFSARQRFRNISLHDRRAVCGRAGRAGHRADTGHRAGPGRPTRRAGRIVRKRPPHLLNAHERPAAEGVNDGSRSTISVGPVIRPSPASRNSVPSAPTGGVGIHPQANAGLVENVAVGTGRKLLVPVRRVGGGDPQ